MHIYVCLDQHVRLSTPDSQRVSKAQVVSLCRDAGDIPEQVDALIRIARLWVLRSDAAEALQAASSALQAARAGKAELAEAQASLGMARVLVAKQDLAAAKAEAGKAEALFKKCKHRPGELLALTLAWSAMLKEGPQQAAQMVQAAKKAAEGFKAAGDPQCAAEAFLEASAASNENGQADESADTATAALQLFRQRGPQPRCAVSCSRAVLS